MKQEHIIKKFSIVTKTKLFCIKIIGAIGLVIAKITLARQLKLEEFKRDIAITREKLFIPIPIGNGVFGVVGVIIL